MSRAEEAEMGNELQQVPLFRGCRRDELRWIERTGTVLHLPAGSTLLQEGRTARDFVVVCEGVVGVGNGEGLALAGPGSHFGHIGLIDGGPHEATVTTQTPVRALVLEARAFRGLLERCPSVSRKLLAELVACVRAGTQPTSRSLAAVS